MKATERLILGTAQLGLNYGINNHVGKPDADKSMKILDIARQNGITTLDTAEAYGDAIHIIAQFHKQTGIAFQIISKFKFSRNPNLRQNVHNTNTLLGLERLYGYLLHDAENIMEPEAEDQFGVLKQLNLIRYSGVSVYTNEQFEIAMNTDFIDIIQLPYNLLDNDFLRGNLIAKAKAKGKIIHTRSVFLQGLFFMDPANLPEKLRPLKRYIVAVNALSEKYGLQKVSVALKYVLGNNNIDRILIGVDSAGQLLDNISAANSEIAYTLIESIDKIQVEETELLNPANWN